MRLVNVFIFLFLTSAINCQVKEKSYSDILVIYPDEIRVEITFVNSDSIDFQEDLPFKMLTVEELKIELKEYRDIKMTLLGSTKIEDFETIEIVKYEMIIDDYEAYKEITGVFQNSIIYEIKGFEKEGLDRIENRFIGKMDMDIKKRFSNEFDLKDKEFEGLEIEEVLNSTSYNHINSMNAFSALKEKFIEGSVGKYFIQEDGSFAWKRNVIVRLQANGDKE